MVEFDPCPVCGSPVTKVTGIYEEGETSYGKLDLGWTVVTVTDHAAFRLTGWKLEPCSCMLSVEEWNCLSLPDEPIHWVHPDELERFINDWRNTHGT